MSLLSGQLYVGLAKQNFFPTGLDNKYEVSPKGKYQIFQKENLPWINDTTISPYVYYIRKDPGESLTYDIEHWAIGYNKKTKQFTWFFSGEDELNPEQGETETYAIGLEEYGKDDIYLPINWKSADNPEGFEVTINDSLYQKEIFENGIADLSYKITGGVDVIYLDYVNQALLNPEDYEMLDGWQVHLEEQGPFTYYIGEDGVRPEVYDQSKRSRFSISREDAKEFFDLDAIENKFLYIKKGTWNSPNQSFSEREYDTSELDTPTDPPPFIPPSETPPPTITPTITPSITPTDTPFKTPTNTTTPSVTVTNTPSTSVSAGASRTPTQSITPTQTPTTSITPSMTETPAPEGFKKKRTVSIQQIGEDILAPSPTSSATPTTTPSITTSITTTPTITPTSSVLYYPFRAEEDAVLFDSFSDLERGDYVISLSRFFRTIPQGFYNRPQININDKGKQVLKKYSDSIVPLGEIMRFDGVPTIQLRGYDQSYLRHIFMSAIVDENETHRIFQHAYGSSDSAYSLRCTDYKAWSMIKHKIVDKSWIKEADRPGWFLSKVKTDFGSFNLEIPSNTELINQERLLLGTQNITPISSLFELQDGTYKTNLSKLEGNENLSYSLQEYYALLDRDRFGFTDQPFLKLTKFGYKFFTTPFHVYGNDGTNGEGYYYPVYLSPTLENFPINDDGSINEIECIQINGNNFYIDKTNGNFGVSSLEDQSLINFAPPATPTPSITPSVTQTIPPPPSICVNWKSYYSKGVYTFVQTGYNTFDKYSKTRGIQFPVFEAELPYKNTTKIGQVTVVEANNQGNRWKWVMKYKNESSWYDMSDSVYSISETPVGLSFKINGSTVADGSCPVPPTPTVTPSVTVTPSITASLSITPTPTVTPLGSQYSDNLTIKGKNVTESRVGFFDENISKFYLNDVNFEFNKLNGDFPIYLKNLNYPTAYNPALLTLQIDYGYTGKQATQEISLVFDGKDIKNATFELYKQGSLNWQISPASMKIGNCKFMKGWLYSFSLFASFPDVDSYGRQVFVNRKYNFQADQGGVNLALLIEYNLNNKTDSTFPFFDSYRAQEMPDWMFASDGSFNQGMGYAGFDPFMENGDGGYPNNYDYSQTNASIESSWGRHYAAGHLKNAQQAGVSHIIQYGMRRSINDNVLNIWALNNTSNSFPIGAENTIEINSNHPHNKIIELVEEERKEPFVDINSPDQVQSRGYRYRNVIIAQFTDDDFGRFYFVGEPNFTFNYSPNPPWPSVYYGDKINFKNQSKKRIYFYAPSDRVNPAFNVGGRATKEVTFLEQGQWVYSYLLDVEQNSYEGTFEVWPSDFEIEEISSIGIDHQRKLISIDEVPNVYGLELSTFKIMSVDGSPDDEILKYNPEDNILLKSEVFTQNQNQKINIKGTKFSSFYTTDYQKLDGTYNFIEDSQGRYITYELHFVKAGTTWDNSSEVAGWRDQDNKIIFKIQKLGDQFNKSAFAVIGAWGGKGMYLNVEWDLLDGDNFIIEQNRSILSDEFFPKMFKSNFTQFDSGYDGRVMTLTSQPDTWQKETGSDLQDAFSRGTGATERTMGVGNLYRNIDGELFPSTTYSKWHSLSDYYGGLPPDELDSSIAVPDVVAVSNNVFYFPKNHPLISDGETEAERIVQGCEQFKIFYDEGEGATSAPTTLIVNGLDQSDEYVERWGARDGAWILPDDTDRYNRRYRNGKLRWVHPQGNGEIFWDGSEWTLEYYKYVGPNALLTGTSASSELQVYIVLKFTGEGCPWQEGQWEYDWYSSRQATGWERQDVYKNEEMEAYYSSTYSKPYPRAITVSSQQEQHRDPLYTNDAGSALVSNPEFNPQSPAEFKLNYFKLTFDAEERYNSSTKKIESAKSGNIVFEYEVYEQKIYEFIIGTWKDGEPLNLPDRNWKIEKVDDKTMKIAYGDFAKNIKTNESESVIDSIKLFHSKQF